MTAYSVLEAVDPVLRPLILEGDRQAVGSATLTWLNLGFCARIVRGRKMRNLGGLFDEFAAGLQFPLYFGENENAFNECISELDYLTPGNGFVVVITEPDEVLEDVDRDEFRWFTRSMTNAAREWATPIKRGNWWDRDAVPFNIVLAGTSAQVSVAATRWEQCGLSLKKWGAVE